MFCYKIDTFAVRIYNLKRSIIKKRYESILPLIFVAMCAICLIGCSREKEEEGLGGSRPNYNMLSDLSQPDAMLYTTEWQWPYPNSEVYTLIFDRTECTFTDRNSGTNATYSYSFNFPAIILTPVSEGGEVITGTITGGTATRADKVNFKNAKGEQVWKEMTRRK